MPKLRLAKNRQEVVGAAIAYSQFIDDLHKRGVYSEDVAASMRNTLSLTQNWVTCVRDDVLIVAPFKWCGWVQKNGEPMTPVIYHDSRQDIGGTSASKLIGEIFFSGNWPAPVTGVAEQEIRRIAHLNDKELRDPCNIYDLPGESLDPKLMMKVEMLAEIISNAKLPKEALDALAGRIAA